MAVRTLSLDEQIEAVAVGIKQIVETYHECLDKGHCDFALAIFGRVAMKVFPSNTFEELGTAYEGMSWCENAEKIING